MKIYIEHSSTNIGDFFYQEAIFLILKDLFKKHEIKYFDTPIQRSFKVRNSFYSKNAFDLRNFIDGDLYILSGPILGKKFVYNYGELIKKIKSEKKEYLILSAFGHDIPEIKSFFKKYPPLGISTRSKDTFNIYNQFSQNTYNGICNAFFLPLYTSTPDIIYKDYIIKSFYSAFEAQINLIAKDNNIDLQNTKVKFKKQSFWTILRHLNLFIKDNDQLNGYEVIRTIHDLSYKFHHLNFSKKNSYISYNILNYLSIYKSSKLIISDRVHAVVIGLAFGVPSILCGEWDRSTIFERLNIKKINQSFIPPEKDIINNELQNYKNWLSKIIR